MEIISEKDNPVLNRKEIVLSIKGATATPSRKEVVACIASKFGVNEDVILVDQIQTEFGTPSCRVVVKIYKDAASIPKKRLEILKARSKSGKEEKKVDEKKEETKVDQNAKA